MYFVLPLKWIVWQTFHYYFKEDACWMNLLVLTQKESYLGYSMSALLEFQMGSGMMILNLLWFNWERLIWINVTSSVNRKVAFGVWTWKIDHQGKRINDELPVWRRLPHWSFDTGGSDEERSLMTSWKGNDLIRGFWLDVANCSRLRWWSWVENVCSAQNDSWMIAEREPFKLWQPTCDWLKMSVAGFDWMSVKWRSEVFPAELSLSFIWR